MKTKFKIPSLLAVLIFTVMVDSADSQGIVIIQHSGYADPTTDGFTLQNYGVQVAPVTNDLGLNAWSMKSINGSGNYFYSLTSQQQAAVTGSDWIVSATFRIVTTNQSQVWLIVSFDNFIFEVTNSGGNLLGLVSPGNSSFFLPGAGSAYNNYQLAYNATADAATFWVDGVEVASGLEQSGSLAVLEWSEGSYGGGIQQVNWNLVSLEITPEPSSVALILLGSGVLIYVRKARRPARAGQIKVQVT